MKIKPIVEGQGEVSAVPELLRRIQFEYGLGGHGVQIGRPIRWNRSHFNSETLVRRAIRLALSDPECTGILIIFDSDDDCPKTYVPEVTRWSKEEAGNIPCEVVMAHREYEAWLLASVESLRGRRGVRHDAVSEISPEAVRGAKECLETKMEFNGTYSPTVDQVVLTSFVDLGPTYTNCRSFRKLVKALRSLLNSAGTPVGDWCDNL